MKLKDMWELVESEDALDEGSIRIIKGRFRGIRYKYGRVRFEKEENPDGTLPLKFEYTIFENPKKKRLNQQFVNLLGDILVEIIELRIEAEGSLNLAGTVDEDGED
jgi:hypothetical protein